MSIRQDLERALGKKAPAEQKEAPPARPWIPPTYSEEERNRIVQSSDGTPLALLPLRDREPYPWPAAVRSGVLCLVHKEWEYLVWDGDRLGPGCCLERVT